MGCFIGQLDQNAGNDIQCCAPSGPQKHTTKKSHGFHNPFQSINYDLINSYTRTASIAASILPPRMRSRES